MTTTDIPPDHLNYRESLTFFRADDCLPDTASEARAIGHLETCQSCRRAMFERLRNCRPAAPNKSGRNDSSDIPDSAITFLHDAIFDFDVVSIAGEPFAAWLRRLRQDPALLERLIAYRKSQLPSDAQVESFLKRFTNRKWCHESGTLKIDLNETDSAHGTLDAHAAYVPARTVESPSSPAGIASAPDTAFSFTVAAEEGDSDALPPFQMTAEFDLTPEMPAMLLGRPEGSAGELEVGPEYADGGHGPTLTLAPGEQVAIDLFPAPAALLLRGPASAMPMRLALAVTDRFGPL